MLFFFNDTATTEIYTLSLHDALPIFVTASHRSSNGRNNNGISHSKPLSCSILPIVGRCVQKSKSAKFLDYRSEEHTSELQSHTDLACRLLLASIKSFQPVM